MMVQPVWLKPGIWGAVVGGVLTMIVGFGWGGWTTSGTAGQMAIKQADAAENERAHDPFAEFRFRDQQCTQLIARYNQSLYGFLCARID